MSKILTERIAEALFEVRDDAYDLDEWVDLDSTDRERWMCDAAAALPIVAEEVRKAKAEVLREAADHIEDVVANARPEQAFTEHVLMEHGGPGYLRELAAEYEESP